MGKRRKYTKEALEPVVLTSISIMEVLVKLGVKKAGGSHAHIKKAIMEFNLDMSHFLGRGSMAGIAPSITHTKESFISSVLCLNGKGWHSPEIKKKLFLFALKEEVCEICDQTNMWNAIPLTLQLDHINGNNRDNRLGNLRIVCPNCHTQTHTFCRNKNKN